MQGAEAIRTTLAILQHYANAINALNTTNIGTSANTPGASLYYALLTQQPSTATASPGDLERDQAQPAHDVLSTWHALKVHCRASTSLLTHLTTTQNTMRLERIDVALAAADAKEKLIEVVEKTSPAMLATALSKFSEDTADSLRTLAMVESTGEVLSVFHHYLFGYATVILTAQDSVGIGASVYSVGDGSGADGMWLTEAVPWLSNALQGADSISNVDGEMQLIVPQLTSLLSSTSSENSNDGAKGAASVTDISAAFASIKDKLETYSSNIGNSSTPLSKEKEIEEEEEVLEEVSSIIMAQLVDLSTTWPAIGSFLQCLHGAQAAATTARDSILVAALSDKETSVSVEEIARSVRSKVAGPMLNQILTKKSSTTSTSSSDSISGASSHWECLELAAAAVDTWSNLLVPALSTAGGTISTTSNISQIDVLQKSISSSVSAAVSVAVQLHFLPAVHALMMKTAAELTEKALKLPTKSGGGRVDRHDTNDGISGHTNAVFTENFNASMLREGEGIEEGAAFGTSAAAPLPAFFGDYSDEEGGALGGLDSLTIEDEEQEEENELAHQMEELDVGSDGNSEEEEDEEEGDGSSLEDNTEDLEMSISGCFENSGALAAVDAVLHVANNTAQQAAQQAQQAQVDLAAHQWLFEPILLNSNNKNIITPEDLKKALQLETSNHSGNGGASSAAATATLLQSPLELTFSALQIPRSQVVSNLKTALSALHSAEEEIQKWKNVALPIENLFSSELLNIAPTATANIQVCLEAGHGWRNTAVMHGMHLKDAVKAVLECEEGRDTRAAADSGKKEGKSGAGDDEMKINFEKAREEYYKAVEHVRAALSTAQSSFTTHQQELDTLRREVHTALEDIQTIEKKHAAAVDAVSNVALPLVKATQKLPATLQTVQDYVENARYAVEVLSTIQRRLSRVHLAAVGSLSSGIKAITLESQISNILENLSISVDSLRTLPTILQTLHYSVDAARRFFMQHGGRGVVAAREQAGGVLMHCKEAMEKLQPLVRSLSYLK